MKSLIREKLDNTFFRQTAVLSAGTLISQLIALFVTLILQRYFFSPAQFGTYNLFLNTTAVFASVATLKYEYAVMISGEELKAKQLFIVSLIASLSVSLLAVFIVLILTKANIIEQGGNIFILLTFFLVLATGWYDSLNIWYNRSKAYLGMAGAKILQSVTGELAKLLLYFTPLTSMALPIGRVLGIVFSAIFLFLGRRKEFYALIKNTAFNDVKRKAIAEKKYPLITTPNVLINSLNAALFSYCIFAYYGASDLGLISVAMQYIAVPLGIISSSFGQIYFQRISEINEMATLKKNYKSNVKYLSLIALFAALIIWLIPNHFYTLILGKKWDGISVYFRICICYMSFSFVSSSVSFIYLKLDKHKLLLYFSVTQVLLTFLSLYFPKYFACNLKQAFISFAMLQACYYSACIYLGLFLLNKNND